ncbi:hypothetical protein [Herbiconiux sp. L3-i23]|uniref:hypothetical protein n=1 Tax=Herbiconiux sp. L3-i23 TaxID=2905871 RepID=UPI00206C954A|nr:hypothetical protein [Herbiconiux sp. L3-i23]BDI22878.1 hypothetical protein L3i23_16540 [Herbiconiux sp. L3-i23]
MTSNSDGRPDDDAAHFPDIPELEYDENIAPRPEEDAADAARSEPDLTDRAGTDGRD